MKLALLTTLTAALNMMVYAGTLKFDPVRNNFGWCAPSTAASSPNIVVTGELKAGNNITIAGSNLSSNLVNGAVLRVAYSGCWLAICDTSSLDIPVCNRAAGCGKTFSVPYQIPAIGGASVSSFKVTLVNNPTTLACVEAKSSFSI